MPRSVDGLHARKLSRIPLLTALINTNASPLRQTPAGLAARVMSIGVKYSLNNVSLG